MFSIQASGSGDDLLLLVSVRHGLQLLLLPLLQLRHHSSLLIPQLSGISAKQNGSPVVDIDKILK